MARSIAAIQQSILKTIHSDPVLAGLTSPSQAALYNLFAYIMSVAMNQEEVLNDAFILDAESAISSNPPANIPWIQRYVFAFQYSATSPQVIQLDTNTLIPYYPVVDPGLRIITRCAVVSPSIDSNAVVTGGSAGTVEIKVAKGTVPQILSDLEIGALQTYLNIIKPAGVIYQVVSADPDKIFVEMLIYYQGTYAGVIKQNVYNAYLNFLANLPFNGVIKVSDLEVMFRTLPGVNDIEFININYRRDLIAFPLFGYNIIDSQTQIQIDSSLYNFAGYVVDETTVGFDFLTINANNFIAQ